MRHQRGQEFQTSPFYNVRKLHDHGIFLEINGVPKEGSGCPGVPSMCVIGSAGVPPGGLIHLMEKALLSQACRPVCRPPGECGLLLALSLACRLEKSETNSSANLC